jgi:hypothetical protein
MTDDAQCHFNMQCWMFFAQILVSMTLIVFCMIMVATKEGPLEVYLPLITSTASVWVPSPSPPKRKSN